MKFGQLIEYDVRNILLEKSQTKWGGRTIVGLFSKNQNWAVSISVSIN